MSIPAAFLKSNHPIFRVLRNATSSQGSGDGVSLSVTQGGPKTAPCGPEAARASRSVPQARDSAPPTNGISGPCSPNSSDSASLQRSLASRLLARLEGRGSPAYSLTWKEWVIEGQEPICAQRASARTTSDKGCSGWPTPIVNDVLGSTHCYGKKREDGTRDIFLKLPGTAKLTGWPTPTTATNLETPEAAMKELDRGANRSDGGCSKLTVMCHLAGWNTPCAGDEKWRCSKTVTAENRAEKGKQLSLGMQAHLLKQSSAATEKPAALNARFSGWLMGYPVEWCLAAIRAHGNFKQKGRK